MVGGTLLQRRRSFLHDADPFGAVEPEVAVGDHGAGLRQLVLGAEDEPDGAADGCLKPGHRSMVVPRRWRTGRRPPIARLRWLQLPK